MRGTASTYIRRDLGGERTRGQETILEAAAQAWIILSSLDDYIARQPSLVIRKRKVVPVVPQRMQIADSLARHLERLGVFFRKISHIRQSDTKAVRHRGGRHRRLNGAGSARNPPPGVI
jgi:hypothetical protein